MGQRAAALDYANRALTTARNLAERDKEDLFGERCLGLAYENLGAYYAVTGDPAGARTCFAEALGIWSRWRAGNLGTPYSTNREKEVLRARAALEGR